ncbi:immune inhibitor A [Mechercharimyces sp. CAU 1602]|uniref:immune inhibitor A n=1 Tax=Mechercharimyces sp. CAU 1602 TaxID=2973933 RepID=UPI002161900D|nr:immune inhibitor A [Mechercharimyces sp. CAU 1602]MCS1351890.1 immune inhibitor A [Mechercharimyces sp. CAU 1602]
MKKTLTALVSSALVLTAMGAPAAPASAEATSNAMPKIDWGIVNEERLADSLQERGLLKKNASQKEIEKAIKEYVGDRKIPQGIDTSTKAGQKAAAGLQRIQEKGKEKIDKNLFDGGKNNQSAYTDNIVLALIEFPDYKHNRLQEDPGYMYTKDFNSSHYEKMMFNKDGYTTPEGTGVFSVNQFYQEQSGGSWKIDGEATEWVEANHNAEYYGGNNEYGDKNPRELVVETLESVGQMIKGNEAKYDQRDPYDIDGDGNIMEPDGMLDNLMIVHSGVGEEAGGGELGEDAIWSHRWGLQQPTAIPGTSLLAFDYMIQPEDGAPGVFAHEYAHNLGLPDLYDTSGLGSPVGYWSLMSAGSWAGEIGGGQPSGMDAWSRLYMQVTFGGNWVEPTEINLNDLGRGIFNSKYYWLREANSTKANNKLLKINLPDLYLDPPTQPKEGESYFSTKGDNLNTKLTSPVIDLSGKTDVKLSFDNWREIETAYDYLYVNVIDQASNEVTQVKVYDDTTEGNWVTEELDLSAFTNKKVQIQFNYVTDGGLALEAFYIDNIKLTADGETLLEDNADDKTVFTLNGFEKFDGAGVPQPNYYLVEYRTHHGMDQGLGKIRRGDNFMSYDPGLLVWYYDGRFGEDNRTSNHPGEGFIGVVDAHQRVHYWNDDTSTPAGERYQLVDAAFGKNKTSGIHLENFRTFGDLNYEGLRGVSSFYDYRDYTLPGAEEVGKILPRHGVKIKVLEDFNKSVIIKVSRDK